MPKPKRQDMKRLSIILICAVALLSATCTPHIKHTIDPATVAFDASYDADFDNVLYTSLVLAMSNYQDSDIPQLFSVSVTAPSNNAVLRVVIDSTALNYVSITQETLPKKGTTYTFYPVIKWKYETLYRLRRQGTIDMTFTCFINDEEVDVKNIRLNYRSVNECLLSIIGANNNYRDYRWLFAAYVNEDHPMIDNMLSEMLDQGIVNSFTGAKDAKTVEKQMRAIWFYALNRGITYSSISCTSNASRKANSQYIRFFDEVYRNRQANCIDACVFFSSIMRKVGLSPIIFVEPCHAYLGYYTDKKHTNVKLLETTITKWVNLPELDKHYDTVTHQLEPKYFDKVSPYLSDKDRARYDEGKLSLYDLKLAVSNTLFDRATAYQEENYEANKAHYSDTSQNLYQMLVVEELRNLVLPIPAVEEEESN